MRCTRHGRACGEPPTLVSPPGTNARYVVRDLLGRGGFARVYLVSAAPDEEPASRRGETGSLNRAASNGAAEPAKFALKVISKCRLGDTAVGREALRNEVSIHRQLQHPAIVRLLSFWEDQYRIYLLMHLVDGPQLERYVNARRRLTEPEACVYAANILEALSYLHANRIVHRDLKLANLLLSRDHSRVMLCDFGLAAHLDSMRASDNASVCGTANYVAPELLTSSVMARTTSKRHPAKHPPAALQKPVGYTTSADLWSMGVVLYTMLVGSGPFDSEDLSKTFRRIRTARFTFPIGLKISPNAKSLIRSLLSEDHTKRPTADQALRHVFFTSHDIPKLFLRPVPTSETRQESHKLDNRSHRETQRVDRDCRTDRVDSQRVNSSASRDRDDRMVGGTIRRAAETRRWSGTHQDSMRQQSASVISQGGYSSSRAERPGSLREDRDRSANHFSTRSLSRAARERSSSLCTAESLERAGSSNRRSSLNTARTMHGLKEPRRAGVSTSSRRSSLHSSDKRTEVLNLSVTLSAALLRGRKFLDEHKGKSGMARRARFETVATRVDEHAGPPPLVRRWLDYTSKYGFATMMEDGRTSCCFNDGSIMFFVSESSDVPDFAYIPPRRVSSNTQELDEEAEKKRANDISKKACLCTLFADMMVDGGRGSMYDLPSACNVSFLKPDSEPSRPGNRPASGEDHKHIVHVREWARFRHFRAAAFRLSNHSIHVKFDVGEDRCDDFLFTPADGMLFYRDAKAGVSWRCPVRHLGEFSSYSEYVHKQLELCSQAISRFLE